MWCFTGTFINAPLVAGVLGHKRERSCALPACPRAGGVSSHLQHTFAKLVTPQKRPRPVSQLSEAGRRRAGGGREETGWEVKGHGGEEEERRDS